MPGIILGARKTAFTNRYSTCPYVITFQSEERDNKWNRYNATREVVECSGYKRKLWS